MDKIKTVNMRRCGPCMACCVSLPVEEIEKPENQRCSHMKYFEGCKIYNEESRPKKCGEFECFWLSGFGRKTDRPDRLGVFFTGVLHARHKFRMVYAYEARDGEAAHGRARQYIKALGKEAVVVAVSPTGKRTIVAGPRAHVEKIRVDMQLQLLQNNPTITPTE